MSSSKLSLKQIVYFVAKWSGAFFACRRITRKGLRVLCYHGIWEGSNEHFSDALFMQPNTFADRMRQLDELGYPVLLLDEAATRLRDGTLPSNATVITIDDGFYSTYVYMLPELERYSFPATIYVASYYSVKEVPITQLLLRFILKSTTEEVVDLKTLGIGLSGSLQLGDPEMGERAAALVNEKLSPLPHQERHSLCKALAEQLNVDLSLIVDSRNLELMTKAELQDMTNRGFDIQLHTHRHRITHDGKSVLTREIFDNRNVLEPIAGHSLKHFCYPSGIYSQKFWPELEAAKLETATTCIAGMNYKATHPYEWRRTLDAESITPLEFEAELCGFGEVMRALRSRLVRRK